MNPPKLNVATLTPDQRDKLDAYHASQKQIATLTDIADMVQEITTQLDDREEGKQLGALLVDIRESVNALSAKEAPESPDYAKPVVEAVSKLEKALSAAIKAIDVKPVLNAPQVNVPPPRIDLKGIEQALKSDIPKAFNAAIKAIPKVELPENDDKPILDKLGLMLEWLESIDTASRMKPQAPNVLKVTNADGSAIGSTEVFTERYDYDDSTTIYAAYASIGTSDATTGWTITKYDLTDTNDASGKVATDVSWSDRASGSFN
jgi:hypothetical protein